METQTKLRNGLEWAGIILLCAAWLLLLEWPLTRPWFISAVMALVMVKLVYGFYLLARGKSHFNRDFAEGLAISVGVVCLLADMMWDLPLLSFLGWLLMVGSVARKWHEGRLLSDSSGKIAG